jgi:hypothetical protein
MLFAELFEMRSMILMFFVMCLALRFIGKKLASADADGAVKKAGKAAIIRGIDKFLK